MATIVEMLDQIIALAHQLKGEAPPDETVPPSPTSRFTNGLSTPDDLGRVELELVEKLVAEFGEAPNGFRIPRLWFVDTAPISHLSDEVRGDHAMRVAGAGFNKNLAYTYVTETEISKGFFGASKTITRRVPRDVIPSCLAWNGSLADLEAALRKRISVLLTEPPYKPEPLTGAIDTVAGYAALQGL